MKHAHHTYLDFLTFKHSLTGSEKLFHITSEAEVEEARQTFSLTPLSTPLLWMTGLKVRQRNPLF